jgi:1-acyl-sn-glycerol-3-phosphate acyltransferase
LNILRNLGQAALLYLLLLLLGFMSLSWNLLSTLLGPLLPAQPGQVLGRAAISHVYRKFWDVAQLGGVLKVDASELDGLRHEPGGMIIAANHPSMLDALLIVAKLPRGVCVMKADLMRNIFLGAGARLARYIRNDSPRSMIRGAVANLRSGAHLVLFPEGTRTVQRPINRFRPGVSLIAHLAKVPIQTVIIETESPYLGKGWPIWRKPTLPVVFRLRLGRRFAPQVDHAALLTELEQYFVSELGSVRGVAA